MHAAILLMAWRHLDLIRQVGGREEAKRHARKMDGRQKEGTKSEASHGVQYSFRSTGAVLHPNHWWSVQLRWHRVGPPVVGAVQLSRTRLV